MVPWEHEVIDGADIPIWLKLLIYAGVNVLYFLPMVFYRQRPFLYFYVLSILMVNIGLGFLINPLYRSYDLDTFVAKQILLAIPFLLYFLWRVSSISDIKFKNNFSGSPLNECIYRVLKGKVNDTVMEWVYSLLLFLNIIWAVRTETVYSEAYWNGCCGLILALTVPLPSSIGRNTPGWSTRSDNDDDRIVDVVAPDQHWIYITVYTSWNLLFSWMYADEAFVGPAHLMPCYVYCVVVRRNDIWVMMRYPLCNLLDHQSDYEGTKRNKT